MLETLLAAWNLALQGVLIVVVFVVVGAVVSDGDLGRRLSLTRQCANALVLFIALLGALTRSPAAATLKRIHSAHLSLQLFSFPADRPGQLFLLGTVLAHVLGDYAEVTFLTYLAVDALFEALAGLLPRHASRVMAGGLIVQFILMMHHLYTRAADTSACVYMALFPYVVHEHYQRAAL